MKQPFVAPILLVLVMVLAWKSRPATEQETPRALNGRSMGTTWTLAWRGPAAPQLDRELTQVLDHWEQVLSQWRESSDLSRFNQGQPASADLTRVIDLAEQVRIASEGAFDHRILESVHGAGFGPAGKGIDLSAIGKGFAVDRVGERLRQLGVNDFVFELGGEVLTGDGAWPAEIQAPSTDENLPGHSVTLRNRALATSGNYRQFVPEGNLLKSHIIDPRTGQPVMRPPAAVSVFAADCATADAWATALFVLGPEFKQLPDGLQVYWQQ
jgi:thiamine biosynthesis lipoprotein